MNIGKERVIGILSNFRSGLAEAEKTIYRNFGVPEGEIPDVIHRDRKILEDISQGIPFTQNFLIERFKSHRGGHSLTDEARKNDIAYITDEQEHELEKKLGPALEKKPVLTTIYRSLKENDVVKEIVVDFKKEDAEIKARGKIIFDHFIYLIDSKIRNLTQNEASVALEMLEVTAGE